MKRLLFFVLCWTLSGVVQAASLDVDYVWSDEAGLQKASACSIHENLVSGNRNRVLEITDFDLDLATPAPFKIEGSYWQVITDGRVFLSARCGSDNLLLYSVEFPFVPTATATSIVVAASPTAALFRFATERSNIELENLLIEPVKNESLVEGVDAFEGGHKFVVCAHDEIIYDDNLMPLDKSQKFETVKLVQSWDKNRQTKKEGTQSVNFLRVEFDQREGGRLLGWMREEVLVLQSQCEGVKNPLADTGIDDRAVTYTFPTIKRTTHNYKTEQRRFGAPRSNGRLHAACDLYRVKGEDVVAVTAGTVIRDPYPFEDGTYALEVKNADGKVIRYGEITKKLAPKISKGKTVSAGQLIGYVGKVNSGCCNAMIHFELFSGKASGGLTQLNSKPYRRRSDLIDPSSYLTTWEKAKFGTSY